MNEIQEKYGAHVLALPYPSQGHICPLLQFCKRLVSKGVKASLAITNYISTTLDPPPDGLVGFVTISDGYDKGGFTEAESVSAYLDRLEKHGSKTLGNLIEQHLGTQNPITCVVYDAFIPWGLNVAKRYGLKGGAFFTQACAANYIYYLVYKGKLPKHVDLPTVDIPGLPQMTVDDLPSFLRSPESYPAYLDLVLNQYCNGEQDDFVLVNTVYELEDKVVDAMSKECKLLTIGPTVPSFYVDNQIPNDKNYGLNLYHVDPTPTTTWLSEKPPHSIVYVSFGSMATLSKHQMEELAWGLHQSNHLFLWVVRASEEDKLPIGFTNKICTKGLIVRWCPQLEVLASEAIGCFVTHCGWNSTLEALTMGVPMIAMPQWTDQPVDAKLVEDVWKVGVRVKVDAKGFVPREEIASRIIQVMDGERRDELIENAKRCKELVKQAINQGGSSDRNIDEFISTISRSLY